MGNETGEDRTARTALSWIFDAGDPVLAQALGRWSAAEVLDRCRSGSLGESAQRRASTVDVPAIRALARASAIRFVIPSDEEWPAAVDDLGHVGLISERGGVPAGLWVRGPGHLAAWSERAVAVVGSRACTSYGQECAADLAATVAESGWTVVSGGAYGIDVAAHRGAVAAGPQARTVAVVACGPDTEYPRGNQALLRHLAETQLVVSESPPGQHPTRIRFLARNRLIAALSAGTVMVEAAARSGARNTMAWAGQLGRIAMAVPGSVHSAQSVGPHQLIRDQMAVLVVDGEQVLEAVAPVGVRFAVPAREPTRALDRVDPELLPLYEVLPVRGYRTVGEVAVATGRSVPAALAGLSGLEARGLAEAHEGGWRAVRIDR